MAQPSFEVGTVTLKAGPYPGTVTVKLFDKSLYPIVKGFMNHFPAVGDRQNPPLGTPTVEYDEYWLGYSGDARPLANLLNLYLWIAVSDPAGLKQLAKEAAREFKNTTLAEFIESTDRTYTISFNVDGKLTAPFSIPDDLMDDAALNGQDNLEEDVKDLFVHLIVRHQMKQQG